jgi:N-acetylmuramoyl-L-alanine amidase
MIIKLTEPQQINGVEIAEVDLKLEKLKGKELLELAVGYRKYNRGEYTPVLELARGFQAFVAGRVSGYNHSYAGYDQYTSLDTRCNEANNWGADYFISVHLNSDGPEAVGIEMVPRLWVSKR